MRNKWAKLASARPAPQRCLFTVLVRGIRKVVIHSLWSDKQLFHMWKVSSSASHWLELISVQMFPTWLFHEYVSQYVCDKVYFIVQPSYLVCTTKTCKATCGNASHCAIMHHSVSIWISHREPIWDLPTTCLDKTFSKLLRALLAFSCRMNNRHPFYHICQSPLTISVPGCGCGGLAMVTTASGYHWILWVPTHWGNDTHRPYCRTHLILLILKILWADFLADDLGSDIIFLC